MPIKLYFPFLTLLIFFCNCGSTKSIRVSKPTDLVSQNTWFIAGPTLENQEIINLERTKNNIVSVTATNYPVGPIELNVMMRPTISNDGKPINLPNTSKYVNIVYKSSQDIKLQAREGNADGTGCIHGGSHPRVNLPASPNSFSEIKIRWSDFRQDELPEGKHLDIHNLCKFNFVNYHPVPGALMQIKSVEIQNY